MNQVAVVITDAASSVNTLSTLAAAKAAFQAGIQVFTIGATQFVNVTELQLMASVPRLQYHEWWTIPGLDSSSLNAIQYNVEMELCRPNYGYYSNYLSLSLLRTVEERRLASLTVIVGLFFLKCE